MTDKIIGYADGGRAVYDNTATVVCILLQYGENPALVVVRRNTEPGKGKLALAGGYQMWGQTWREAGAREVKEETGYTVIPTASGIHLESIETDEYNNNVIIAHASCDTSERPKPTTPEEVQEVVVMTLAGDEEEWAFPLHYNAAKSFFNSINSHW